MRRLFPLVTSKGAAAVARATGPAWAACRSDAGQRSSPLAPVAQACQFRAAGTRAGNADGAGLALRAEAEGEDHHDRGDTTLLSTEFREEDEDANEDFDELEAASQEVHDLCFGMIAFLRRADPDATKDLFERRVKRRMREPVPEQRRRLIHGHGDRSTMRRNTFASDKDLKEATELYFQIGSKLMLLLNRPLMDRLLESGGKGFRDMRSDGVHKYKRPIERASWRTFPHRWFKHAPFEVQQLRADIPQLAVLNTRFYRDHSTVRYLFTLMEPQHPFRAQIEKRMFEITQQYDPMATGNRTISADSSVTVQGK